MAVYDGAPVRALGGRLLPTYYLAIRDPSSIRVKNVEQAPRPRTDGVRYVNLIFERERIVPVAEAVANVHADGPTDAAFIITVSLPIAREEQFCREVLPSQPEDWTEMFERLCSLDSRRG